MKFVLFVEGPTEQKAVPDFLKRWLDPRLKYPVGIKPICVYGCDRMPNDLCKKAQMHLDGPEQGEIIAAVGLLDLHGPSFYPSHLTSACERLKWAVEELEKKVNRPSHFKMFFAVHDIEAWLLSEPNLFPSEIKKPLSSTIKGKSPEDIDFDEPPKKLLKRLYRQHMHMGRGYKQVVDGISLFRRLNPDVVYKKCPELRRMLDEIWEWLKR